MSNYTLCKTVHSFMLQQFSIRISSSALVEFDTLCNFAKFKRLLRNGRPCNLIAYLAMVYNGAKIP